MTPAPRSPGAGAVSSDQADVVAPTDEAVWRRMHPITPVLKGWQVIAVLLVIGTNQVGDNVVNAQRFLTDGGWRWALLVLAATAVVGGAWASLAWRMTSYAVDDRAVHLRTGILVRQRRQARLDRLQAVDVVKPFLGRIFGLAKLTLEVAGGAGSAVELAFLKESEAEALRAELLARAAGLHQEVGDDPAPVAPEQQVFELAPTRLIGSLLLSGTTFVLVPALIGLTIWAASVHEVGPVVAMLPAVLGVGSALWSRFAREFGFRAAISPDGIRLRHGLLEQRAQTVPPGRVQAVRVTQGPLWRTRDWWRVQINVAGYGIGQGAENANVLLPVGSRSEALHAIWLVLPDLGVPDPRETLDAGLSGSGTDRGFLTMPRRSRWLDPWGWRRRGVLVTDRALLIRSGWFVRHLVLVPHERTQSLALQQGPWQRALGVSSLTVHSTPGPVTPVIAHLDAADATRLLTEQADRARAARATAGPEQWMSRPTGGAVEHG
ncbi:PH domain-containing protein [Cellulomonas sp. P24]|uniref:PH domain-containing protein n=1 Tax=Cellulomonas sp. P24 TaxID=2885206 RepID=UPI00216B4EBD|nr:PH domain-containing protein [Cellulomonas sp. P24]MCR6493367.1 PH domain-containing protein [Cellulomonas sp. P24]